MVLGTEKMALPIFRTLIQSATGPEMKRSAIDKDGTYDHRGCKTGLVICSAVLEPESIN